MNRNTLLRKGCGGIACIGDSITEGFGGGSVTYPAVLKRCFEEAAAEKRNREADDAAGTEKAAPIAEIPDIVNLGVRGEDSVTILGRTGAVPFQLAGPVTVRQNGYPAELILTSPLTPEICPLVYGNAGIEKIWLTEPDGTEIPGRLTMEGGYFTGERMCFRPDAAADFGTDPVTGRARKEITFPAGTKVIPRAAQAYRNYMPVVYMGANGQFETVEELILQHKALLSFYQVPEGMFLVLGFHVGTREEMRETEAAFRKAFGDRYVNVRDYMSTCGLADAGFQPEGRDEADMAAGRTPESLLSDGLHFNSAGYRVLGRLVYRNLRRILKAEYAE